MSQKHKHHTFLVVFAVAFPILVCLTLLWGNRFLTLLQLLPVCGFYARTQLYCPTCGLTRSVMYLLRGKPFLSLYYHILPIFSLLLLLAFYAETLFLLGKKKVALLPRNIVFWVVVIIGFWAYVVFRNFGLYD